MRIVSLGSWVFYIEGKPQFDEHKVGKWMYFFKDKERAAGLCKTAVEQGIVLEAKHSDAPDGVSCILEVNGIEWGMDSMSAKDVFVLDGK